MPPIYYDVTHLRHNAGRAVLSGIRRVDFEFARHLFARPDVGAVEYRVGGIGVLRGTDAVAAILRDREDRDERARQAAPRSAADLIAEARAERGDRRASRGLHRDLLSFARLVGSPPSMGGGPVARGAVYLNIAQHNFGHDLFFAWLRRRPDVRALFFIHDLLPLDYPEFWPAGYAERFRRGIETVARVAAGFLVSSHAVAARLAEELARLGRRDVPLLAHPFPVFGPGPAPAPQPAAAPYFVMVGTLEPRKNHLLVLNVWRRIAEAGGPVPTLVVIGKRGWGYDPIVALLERSRLLQAHVVEASAAPDATMQRLVAEARALLFPSFAEGFGLPVAEALAAGTPVVAADLPVLRETAQGQALFLDPLDGLGWSRTVLDLCQDDGPVLRHARALAQAFRPGEPPAYFRAVDAFVDGFR